MQTETIWNDIYSKGPQTSSGKPGLALSQFVGPLRVGTALELGCARGDDAVWLARQGWHVTAVDVSSVALDIASRNAVAAGVADRIAFEAHDLALSFSGGAIRPGRRQLSAFAPGLAARRRAGAGRHGSGPARASSDR